jgi:hypothetical protein
MDFMGTDITLLKFTIHVIAAAFGWSIAFWIRASYRSWASDKCNSGHKKKYVALTCWTNVDCKVHGRHTSDGSEWWSTWATWKCETQDCTAVGEDCLGTLADWRLEYGKVVVDEKSLATRKDRKGPKTTVMELRAEEQGLARPINVNEALGIMLELAVQVKKGKIGPLPSERPQTQEPPVAPKSIEATEPAK